MVANVSRTSSIRQEFSETCHFIFCCNSSHFAAFHLQNKKMFLYPKFKKGEKEAREKGTGRLTRSRCVDDKAETQTTRDND